MSEKVIKVEGLGKKYIIGHEGNGSYKTMREQMVHGAKSILFHTKQLFSGQQILNGDNIEEFWALKNVSFELRHGERLGIIGRNGAGKSTLLKILSRITEPTTGRITINGRVASLLEVGTGFHQELTGRENIFLNGAILGMNRNEIKRKFDEIVDFSGVEKFLDTPVKRYSSGMYVRLAFAIAAHLEPEILIVDEVLAVGDVEFQEKCLGKMNEVSKNEGRTVLFVSHQLGMISELCSRCIVLDKGSVVKMDTTEKAIEFYVHNQPNDNVYKNTSTRNKGAYVSQMRVIDENGVTVSELEHHNRIILELDIIVNEVNRALGIGLAMLDKYKRRVFTINFNIGQYFIDGISRKKIHIYFPPDIFIPGPYSWAYTVNFNIREVFDSNIDCCSFKIVDLGSEYAAFENFDNGVIFLRDYIIKCL